MIRIEYICFECDNECRLSMRGDSTNIPVDCPVDARDDCYPKWEEDEND